MGYIAIVGVVAGYKCSNHRLPHLAGYISARLYKSESVDVFRHFSVSCTIMYSAINIYAVLIYATGT